MPDQSPVSTPRAARRGGARLWLARKVGRLGFRIVRLANLIRVGRKSDWTFDYEDEDIEERHAEADK